MPGLSRPDHAMIRHLAFFQTLAELDEGTPRWNSVTAGLLVVRTFDSWIEHGEKTGSYTELSAVRREIEKVENGPSRLLLEGILAEIQLGARTPADVLPRLLAYGRTLHMESEWNLAADVLERVVELSRQFSNDAVDNDLTLGALQQLALSLRVQGRFDEAEATYSELERLASASSDWARVLRARVGYAKIALSRGNLPMAERMLDEVIAEARQQSIPMMAGVALHDRAAVAHARGEHAEAVRMLFEALHVTDDPTSRDGLLGDIAANLISLGAYAPARDALMVLTLTAQEALRRLSAEINLFEIAMLEKNEMAFEQHRKALAGVAKPPEMAAHYHMYAARGLLAFGRDSALVRRELTRARSVCDEHEYNQLQFQLDALEEAIVKGEREVRQKEAAVSYVESAGLSEVVNGLTRLRLRAEAKT